MTLIFLFFFFFQAEDGIRDLTVTGVQTCALPILIELDHRFARAIGCTWKVQGNPRRRLDCKSGGVRRQRFGKLNAHDLGASLDGDRKSTRLNSSHSQISYAVFCLKKKKTAHSTRTPLTRSDDPSYVDPA